MDEGKEADLATAIENHEEQEEYAYQQWLKHHARFVGEQNRRAYEHAMQNPAFYDRKVMDQSPSPVWTSRMSEWLRKGIQEGEITLNDVRKGQGLPPIEESDGS